MICSYCVGNKINFRLPSSFNINFQSSASLHHLSLCYILIRFYSNRFPIYIFSFPVFLHPNVFPLFFWHLSCYDSLVFVVTPEFFEFYSSCLCTSMFVLVGLFNTFFSLFICYFIYST